MDLQQIEAFVRCAEAGSVSAAARQQRLPKSTVSRLVVALEQDLRVRLFNRSARGLALTDEGLALLEHGREVLDAVQRAAAAVGAAGMALSGVVRVTAPYTFGVTYVSPHLASFFAAHPKVDVHLELSSRNLALVEEGYDLAVRIGEPPETMVARLLMSNPLRLLATPAYLARHGAPQAPSELERHALLVIGRPRSRAAIQLTRDGQTQLVNARPRLVCTDPALVLRAALDGCGIGEVPEIIARRELATGSLVDALPGWRLRSDAVYLIAPRERAMIPRVRAFAGFLVDAITMGR